MPLPLELTARRNGQRSRLCDLLARTSSENVNEAGLAARAVMAELRKYGADIHDLIDHVENPPLNAHQIAEIQKAIDEKAKQLAEAERAEGPRPNFNGAEFRSTDGSDDMDDWRQLATFIDENKQRLSPRDYNDWAREFIDDMTTRARHDPHYQVRPKQYVELRKFAVRLGWRSA
jgi:hypothetical protein